MFSLRVAGVGSYLPPNRVSSAELERLHSWPQGWIERTTGVRERRNATNETSAQMAARAAERALQHAGLEGRDLDLIIGASASQQQCIPCTSVFVQKELGLESVGVPCFDINVTCLSFLQALHTAAHFLEAGTYRRILVYSSEITSLSLNWGERESSALFGDAAAAVVLTRAREEEPSRLWSARFLTDSSGAHLTQMKGGGTLNHPNNPATTPDMNQFTMQGGQVFKAAMRQMPPFLDAFFAGLPWQKSDVDAVVPHQASLHAIAQLTKRLGFTKEQVVVNLPERGNCIAASIPLALCEAVEAGRIGRGHKLLLLGTGAGLSLGAVALTF